MCDDITLLSITEICTTKTDDDDENDGLMTYEAAQLMRSLKIKNYPQRVRGQDLARGQESHEIRILVSKDRSEKKWRKED